MLPGILAYALRIVDANKNAMSPGTWLGIDGSWNHHRNVTEHIVEFVDCRNRKIVDFEIVSRDTRFNPGNYTGAANGMECVSVETVLIKGATETRATGIVCDKDSKTRKVIERSQWTVAQVLDVNDCTKAFLRKWDRLKADDKERIQGLKERLRRFLRMVVYSEADLAAKVDMWLNAENHIVALI
jgi:hypothetical protein